MGTDDAVGIARAAAEFEWTWTADDIGRFARRVGWTVSAPAADPDRSPTYVECRTFLQVNEPEATFAIGAEGGVDVAWLGVTDVRPARQGPVPAVVFEEFVDRFRSVFGEPSSRSDNPGYTPAVDWGLPTVVITLTRDDAVYLRLAKPRDPEPVSTENRVDELLTGLTDRARAGAEFADRIAIVLAADFGRGFGPIRVPGPGPERQPRPEKRWEPGADVVGSWSRTEILRLCHDLGWTLEANTYDEHADGPHLLSLLVSKVSDYQKRFGYGEYVALHLNQYLPDNAVDDAFRLALRECVRLLGTPHLVGGPDAFAKWRYTDTTIELSRDFGLLGAVMLSVRPSHAYEWEEGRDQEYGEYGEDWVGKLWQLQPDVDLTYALGGSMYYPEPPAEDWEELGWNLEQVFASLAADLPVLDPFATEVGWAIKRTRGAEAIARGWFAPQGGMLEVARDGVWEQQLYPSGAEAGRAIAAATIAAIRAGGAKSPRELTVTAQATRPPQRLNDIRFGIGGDGIDWGDGDDDDLDDDDHDDDDADFDVPSRPGRASATPRTNGQWEQTAAADDEFLHRLTAIAENQLRVGGTAVPDEDAWVIAQQWRDGAEAFRGVAGSPPPAVDPHATAALIGILDSCRPRLTAMLAAAERNGLALIAHAAAAYLAAPGSQANALGAAAIWVLVEEDYWECCQAAFPHMDHVERDILPRFLDSWIACFGLAFAAETVVLARGFDVESSYPHGALVAMAATDCGRGSYDQMIRLVRAHLAAAPEPTYRHVAAHLSGLRARLGTVWGRIATSYLLPHRQDWVDADLAVDGLDRYSDSAAMLATSVTRPDQYARLRDAVGMPTISHLAQVYSLLVQVGPDCFDVVADWMTEAVNGVDDLRSAAEILAWIPTDEAYETLLDLRENDQVTGALTLATARYPHRALRLLCEARELAWTADRAGWFDPFGLLDAMSALRTRIGMPARMPVRPIPVASVSIVGLCAVVYVIAALQAHSFSPTTQNSTLYAQLMMSRGAVVNGQVWRVFSGGLVAGNLSGLLFLAVSAIGAGYFVEPILGRLRVLAISATATVGGSAAIMWLATGPAVFGANVVGTSVCAILLTLLMLSDRYDRTVWIGLLVPAVLVLWRLWVNPNSVWGLVGAVVTAVVATLGFVLMPRRAHARTDRAARTSGWRALAVIALAALTLNGAVIAILA
ncbi:DUF6301 family protein [Nocardia sp. NPDC057663]|uniref:DUF6301 family protein n=1 Tax=Nocardia sp. NPDC057663 TaxID=3346201 RepID=UPI00366DD711